MKIIAHIENDFTDKFGIPRQSGLIEQALGRIVFEKEYRVPAAVRGLEQFSHIWLIWEFSQSKRDGWSPTVRPPRLGGNERMGVFATRSPFRPNPIGLSAVRLLNIDYENGPILTVAGADLLNGTPIYDIKPYVPYADCRPDAAEGYTALTKSHLLRVSAAPELLSPLSDPQKDLLIRILEQDPRPAYIDDPDRIFGIFFGEWNVTFRVAGDLLTVAALEPRKGKQ